MTSDGGRTVPGELRELHDDELVTRLREAKEELFNLRFQMATGQLDNNRRLRTVRHDIARIYTIMRERELGLSVAPRRGCRHERADDGPRRDGADAAAPARPARAWWSATRWTRPSWSQVEDRVKHPLYGKVIRRTSKLKAHDETERGGVGDRVLLMETRPLSATKRWRSSRSSRRQSSRDRDVRAHRAARSRGME